MQRDVEILVVEDDPGEAELTLYALRAAGIGEAIEHARDGDQALDRLFGRAAFAGCPYRPRLIVLDLKMPSIDGFEVLRQLKEDSRTREIPVVIFSSSFGDLDVQRCHSLGACGFVRKPVMAGEFRAAITEIVRRWLPARDSSAAVQVE